MPQAAIPALITGGLGIVGNLIGGHSTSQAANDQVNAANQGINTIQGYNTQTRTDLMPWLTAGQSSLGALTALLGLGGAGAQQQAITGLQNGPLFQSLYRQGQNAILGNASATGGLRGGNTEGALYNLGSDTLAQVIQNQIGNLTGLSDAGLRTGGLLGQFGADAGNSIANLLGQAGAARAGGALANGDMWSSILGTVGGAIPGLFGGSSGGGIPSSLSGGDPLLGLDPIANSVGF